MRYSTPNNWAKYLRETEGIEITASAILSRIEISNGITGRCRTGKLLNNSFYKESDIRKACTDLFKEIPQAGSDGFFELDNKKFGTCESWAEYFKESEGIQVNANSIRVKLQEEKVVGLTARNKIKHILNNAFYSEDDVRLVCQELLERMPHADKNGFFYIDNEKYGSIGSFFKELGISVGSIKRRIKLHKLKATKGKDVNGHVLKFYTESQIRECCSDLMKIIPKADMNGFITVDNAKYGSVGVLFKELGVDETAVKSRIEKSKLKPIEGKGRSGSVLKFYAVKDVRKLCNDLLQEIPQADENGFIVIEDERFGTLESLSRSLEISSPTIKKRVVANNIKAVKCKDNGGRIANFYSEAEVKIIFSDLLQDAPKANDQGVIAIDNVEYASLEGLAKLTGVSTIKIASEIKKGSLECIKGRGKTGIFNYYPVSEVRDLCADFLAKRSKTNPKAT